VHNLYSQRVLLVSSIRWPVSAKLALAFLRNGCEVQAVCPKDHPFAFVTGIRKIYPYRGMDSIQSLYEAITASGPDLLVPCDDVVVWQMHELYRTRPEIRPLIERSLGAATAYEIVSSRGRFMKIVEELQLRAPKTKEIAGAADLKDWFSKPSASGVLKLDWTCAGKGVRIVDSLSEAEEVFAEMTRQPHSIGKALARWILNHDPLALWKWGHYKQQLLTMQEFIPGRPANTLMACQDGKVLGLVTVEVLFANGVTGSALAVQLVENEEIRTAAERIAERLQLSGFHGLDFVLEEGTGHAYLIELNPRCTQLGHLRVGDQGDLAGALSRAFTGAPLLKDHVSISQKKVAFFPEAMRSEPKCPFLETAYIDVPWEETRLVKELINRDWSDRTLLARLFRGLRPPKRKPVAFKSSAWQRPSTAIYRKT
jgi:ATP-grasp domain